MMGGLFSTPARSTQAPSSTTAPLIPGWKVQTALAGLVRAVVYGVNLIPGNIFYASDFCAVAVTTYTASGGQQMGGKGGGQSQAGSSSGSSSTEYYYYMAVFWGLCEGPVQRIGKMKADKQSQDYGGGGMTLYKGDRPQEPNSWLVQAHPDKALGFYGLAHIFAPNAYMGTNANLPNWCFEVWALKVYQEVQTATDEALSITGGVTLTGAVPRTQIKISRAAFFLADQGVKWQDGGASLTKIALSGADPGPGEYMVDEAGNYYFSGYDAGKIALATYDYNAALGANPAEIIPDVLENPDYGAPAWPAGKIADLTQFSDYCRANGFFLSPVFAEQKEVREHLTDLIKLLNSQFVWCDDMLDVVPLGDEAVTGHGVTFTPNNTPVMDLDENDFIFAAGDDPVQTTVPSQADIHNKVPLEYLIKDQDYVQDVVSPDDLASIEAYGLRPLETVLAHSIIDPAMALAVARNILHYSLYAKQPYKFKVGIIGDCFKILNLVTLTCPRLGLDHKPVYITNLQQSDGLIWEVEAYYWPFGSIQAALYPFQARTAYGHDFNQAPGNVNPPLIFEPPMPLTGYGLEVWVAACGGENWGGCEIWGSVDNETYKKVGEIVNPARAGILSAALPLGDDPDEINTLAVDLTESRSALISGSQADVDNFATPCYVDGEIICYKTSTLTGANKYDLTYLRRGCYHTAVSAHDLNSRFVRLDGAVCRFPYKTEQVGNSIWLKFLSWNTVRGAKQELAEVEPYQYQVTGAGLKLPPPDVTGVVEVYDGQHLWLKWPAVTDPLGAYRPLDYEIRQGSTWAAGQIVGLVKDPEFQVPGNGTYWIAARTPLAYSSTPASMVVAASVLPSNLLVSHDEAALDWPGLVGRALSLDGSHYATAADHADFRPGAGPWTIEAVIKADAVAATQVIVSKYGGTGQFALVIGSGDLQAYIVDESNPDHFRGALAVSPDDQANHYLAATWEPGDDLRLYLDGLPLTCTMTGAVGAWNPDNAAALGIGANADGSNPLVGQIALARFTKRAKTAAEILAEGAYLLAGQPPELLDAKALYAFRDALTDDSAGAHDLTWQGGGSAAYAAGVPSPVVLDGGDIKLDTAVGLLGYYLIKGTEIFDQGACKPAILAMNLTALVVGAADFDGVAEVDALPDFDQAGAGSVLTKVQIALSPDGETWGPWQDFFPGIYNFWQAKPRLVLSTGNTNLAPVVPGFDWAAYTPWGYA